MTRLAFFVAMCRRMPLRKFLLERTLFFVTMTALDAHDNNPEIG